jgi:hypothetical protein
MHLHLSSLAIGALLGFFASVLPMALAHWVITAKAEAAKADAIYRSIVQGIAKDAGHIETTLADLEAKVEPPSTPSTKT